MSSTRTPAILSKMEILRAENEELRMRLEEAEEVIEAIRRAAVDAVVMEEQSQARVYTLEGAERPYRSMVETMKEGAVTLGMDQTILYSNQSFAQIIQTPLQKVIGSPFTRYLREQDRSSFQAFLRQSSEAKYELVLLTEAGTQVPVYLSRSETNLDSMAAICLVVTDLTQQKRHEEVVAAERLARSILEQAGEAIIVCNEEGLITHASAQAHRLCGRNPLWEPFERAFPLQPSGDENGRPFAERKPTPLYRPSDGTEVVFHREDGRRFYLLWSSNPLHNDTGDVLGSISVLMDITDRKKTEAERERLLEELAAERAQLQHLNETLEKRVAQRTAALEKRNHELQQFAYIASHDMQEPLRKIQTFAGLMIAESGNRLDSDGLFYLERMQKAAARLSTLLQDLLSYSRVSTRNQPFIPVHVGGAVAEVLSDLEMLVLESEAEIEIDADVSIEADPGQLRQVLNHLIQNALKFRRPNVLPCVRIYTTHDTETPSSIPQEDSARQICRIQVEDNGIGFDPSYADRIFEPFQRLHGKNAYPGTGMGLAICRRIVERHHGKIMAESTPGVGSRFIITLPVRQDDDER